MNILRKVLIKIKVLKAEPHEKAESGQSLWGRQSAISKPKSTISAKVIRKDGTTEDLGIISGRK